MLKKGHIYVGRNSATDGPIGAVRLPSCSVREVAWAHAGTGSFRGTCTFSVAEAKLRRLVAGKRVVGIAHGLRESEAKSPLNSWFFKISERFGHS